jgi:transposase
MPHVRSEDHDRIAEAMKQTKDIRWYQRLHIIHLSAKGKSVPELAEVFDKCPATIRGYIHRYNRGGLASLKRQFRAGAPVQIPFNKAAWEELLHQSPSEFARLQTAARNWNQSLLVAYLQGYHHITVTRQAVAANLKRHGIRVNRGRLKVISPDPLYTVKRDYLDALKKRRRRNAE